MKIKEIITKRIIKTIILAMIISVILNVVLLVIIKPIANAPDTFSPFQYWPVIELTALGVLAAGFVYLVIKRFYTHNYKKIFVWLSIITLIMSFIPDIMLPYSPDRDNQGATMFIVCILILMHILTAGIVISLFTTKTANRL